MKINLFIGLIFSCCFLIASTNISAQSYTYKWKSADGEVHYTERPPAVGIPFTKIRVKDDSGKSQPQNNFENSSPKEETASKDNGYKNWRDDNCKIANQNLDMLENAGRISEDDGQGGTRLMTDEEKKVKLDKMKAQRDKYCSEEPKK